MSVLESKVSVFKSTTEIKKLGDYTLRECLEDIRSGKYKELTDKLRSSGTKEEASGFKKRLPTCSVHGQFKTSRKKEDFINPNGIVVIDIDDITLEDPLEDIKQDIMDFEYVIAAMISPSGTGIKVLALVEEGFITTDNYREVGKVLSEDFRVYEGTIDILSITDCLLLSTDSKILINEEAVPKKIFLKEKVLKKSNLEPLDKSKTLWDDVEMFYETVLLNSIQQKTNNNFHFIQVSILDLAKYGFNHPQHDLQFVIDYSEDAFHSSSENKDRFLGAVEAAKDVPQSLWPYKTTRKYEEESTWDYSEFTSQEDFDPRDEEDLDEESEEEESDGLVDYSTFLQKVLDKAKEGDRVGAEISLENFADIFRFYGTGILTVTGIPSHGKTEWTDQCLVDLARLYLQESIVVGFEQSPEEHVLKLSQKLLGKSIRDKSFQSIESNIIDFKNAITFITSKIKHIDTDNVGGDLDKILKVAAKQIQKSRKNKKEGVKYLLLDPFNMLSIKSNVLGHEKVELMLRQLTHFSHQMKVLVILVAHPFKMKKDEKTGQYDIPDFYSVKGSSAFYEMSYHGLVVYRIGFDENSQVLVRVLKVKQNSLGKTMGEARFLYQRDSGRYTPLDNEGNIMKGDHFDKDWLQKALELENETK